MKNVALQPQSRAIAIINSHHDFNDFKASGQHFRCRHIVFFPFVCFVTRNQLIRNAEWSANSLASAILLGQQATFRLYGAMLLTSSSSKWPNNLIKYHIFTDQKLSTKAQDVLYKIASHNITQISHLKCSKWNRLHIQSELIQMIVLGQLPTNSG